MAQRGEGAFVLHGRKAALREKPYEFLSNTQKTTSSHNLSFQGPANHRRPHASNRGQSFHGETNVLGRTLSQYTKENPSIDDLEDNLRKLKVQVDSLASSLNVDYEKEPMSNESTDSHIPQWPTHMNGTMYTKYERTTKTAPDYELFIKSRHLENSTENYSTMQNSGLPIFSRSSLYRPPGILTSTTSSTDSSSPSVNPLDTTYGESYPVKLGAPHVIGVKSLLPPKIPVRSRSPNRTRDSIVRGRSQSLDRSHSFSPASKKTRWLRSRSQSPKPIWRPNSAKANACSQQPPRLRSSGKTSSSNRQSRSRSYRPGALVTRSFTPPRKTRSSLSYSWSPYSIPSAAITAPSVEEISERFLKTLTERDAGVSLVETSPYQQELARLRLERLRVEEDLLLEIKRQQELERTRGPKPKWYEMKNSQFHYEARKNNELLKSSNDYQAIYDYRQDLTTASRDFQENLKITHLEPA
ncbi:uncharacterized protein LOC134577588 [Pelobates fuscus]|uniref:uncharacterized protein LOC134577588 n=1 Tax=Pelobates fuscus TaxID=191477 RepID=UPI002FE4798D